MDIPQVTALRSFVAGSEHVFDDTFSCGREFVAALLAELDELRSVVVFADGFVVSQTGQFGDHQMALADLYNDTCPAATVIQRAGCHPRGRFK